MLSQKFNSLERCKQRIKSTSSLIRRQCCMGAFSMEGYMKASLRQTAHIRTGIGASMHHKSHIQIVEASFLDHITFGTQSFLCRSSIHHNPERTIRIQIFKSGSSAQTGRPLHMVAASVAQSPKRIILTEDSDNRTAFSVAVLCPESSFITANSHFYGKSVFSQIIGQQTGGKNLFSLILRIVENLIRHGPELLPFFFNPLE